MSQSNRLSAGGKHRMIITFRTHPRGHSLVDLAFFIATRAWSLLSGWVVRIYMSSVREGGVFLWEEELGELADFLGPVLTFLDPRSSSLSLSSSVLDDDEADADDDFLFRPALAFNDAILSLAFCSIWSGVISPFE